MSGQVPTSFTKLIGKTTLTVDVSSEVVWGMRKLELALALDNTGSMASSNKMTELKKAAKNLLRRFKTAAKDDGDIKVAIIPFAQEVNVGTSNVNATWLHGTNGTQRTADLTVEQHRCALVLERFVKRAADSDGSGRTITAAGTAA